MKDGEKGCKLCQVAGRPVPQTDRKTGLQENQAGAASHSAEGGGEEECSGNQGHHIGDCGCSGLPARRLCILLPQPEHRAGSRLGHGLKDFLRYAISVWMDPCAIHEVPAVS